MKRFLSILLCITMIISVVVPTVFAKEAEIEANTAVFGEGEYPIVFVTGIGQSWSYIRSDKEGEGDVLTLNGEDYRYSKKANLFIFDITRVLKNLLANPKELLNVGVVLAQLATTFVFNRYCVSQDRLRTLAKSLLTSNIIDENGKLPEYVFTPRYNCPLSEYPDGEGGYGKSRFYRDVPCQDILEAYGEEKVFCFNYAPFGNISDVSKGLDTYINDVVFKYYPDAGKVVLIPMSMGAAMVSQYLYDYGAKNQVARVISIVGCWNGSDIVADLIENKYIETSNEMFYSAWPELLGDEFTGNILNIVMHLFHKENLSSLIDGLLGAVCDELLLKTPTLLALIPSYRYDAIRNKFLTREGYEDVLKQLDIYHEAQVTLKDRMEKLNKEQGMEFYFISGYNLGYGGFVDSDYKIFKFIYSSNKVNSDEIINIESTAPGATSVPVGQTFSDEYLAKANPEYISPDKSVDLSTCYYPDRCWIFNGQKHELADNNTAIKLAFSLARGQITSAAACKDVYPQFNDSRDISRLRDDVKWFEEYIETNKDNAELAELVEKCEKAIEEANKLMDNTINNREKDDEKIEEIRKIRIEIENFGVTPEEPDNSFGTKVKDFFDKGKVDAAQKVSDFLYNLLGPKGFLDQF